eukprot:5678235-Alexandrium_andersonii.AAC.1
MPDRRSPACAASGRSGTCALTEGAPGGSTGAPFREVREPLAWAPPHERPRRAAPRPEDPEPPWPCAPGGKGSHGERS